MTETIKLQNCFKPDSDYFENARYGSLEELKELLLYKRIVKWDKDHLELEDGTKVTIEMSENDCCAYAGQIRSGSEKVPCHLGGCHFADLRIQFHSILN